MRLAAIALGLLLAYEALAVDDGQAFADPEQQFRYEGIIRELRCLVCQNQSIADSNAMLAADLRREVRDMIQAGRSDNEIRAFMTERYGDFVLYKPPIVPRTWILWVAPALLLFAGFAVAGRVILRRASAAKSDPTILDDGPDPP